MRKETILLPLILLIFSADINAQNNQSASKRFSITPVVGIQTFGIEKAGTILSLDRIGVSYGALVEFKLSDKWGIQTGILNMESGGDFVFVFESINGFVSEETITVNGNHLTLPLSLNYYFGKNKRWHFDSGVNYNIRILDSEVRNANPQSDLFENLGDYFGLHFYLGHEIPIGRSSIHIRIGGSSGINSPFFSTATNPPMSLFSEYSQVSTINTIGYKFTF